jgi:hypothetical protein
MEASSKLSIFLTASLKLNIGKYTNLSLNYKTKDKQKKQNIEFWLAIHQYLLHKLLCPHIQPNQKEQLKSIILF